MKFQLRIQVQWFSIITMLISAFANYGPTRTFEMLMHVTIYLLENQISLTQYEHKKSLMIFQELPLS